MWKCCHRPNRIANEIIVIDENLEMATRISCVVEFTQRLGSTTVRWNRRCNSGVLEVTLLLSPLVHDCPDDNDCELSEEEDCSSHDKTCQMRHNEKSILSKTFT